MGFLRSAAKFLQQGPSNVVKVKKKPEGDDSEPEDEDIEDPEPEDDDDGGDEDESNSGRPSQRKMKNTRRGTIVVTLRDKAPYTLWYVFKQTFKPVCLTSRHYQCRDLPRLAKRPPPPPSNSSTAKPNPRYTQVSPVLTQSKLDPP